MTWELGGILAALKEKASIFLLAFVATWIALAFDGQFGFSLYVIHPSARSILSLVFIVSGVGVCIAAIQKLWAWNRARQAKAKLAKENAEKAAQHAHEIHLRVTAAIGELDVLVGKEYEVMRSALMAGTQIFVANRFDETLNALIVKGLVERLAGDSFGFKCSYRVPWPIWEALKERKYKWTSIKGRHGGPLGNFVEYLEPGYPKKDQVPDGK